MNRRTVLKQALIITAGTALLPYCAQDKPSIALRNISLSSAEEKLVAALSNAIIPTTPGFYGAAEVKAHEFTLMMIDECESPEVQKIYSAGLKAFSNRVDEDYHTTFTKLKDGQQNEILSKLESKSFAGEDLQKFYSLTKSYTLLAFTSSPKYMKEVRKYKMVPGSNFKGCVLVG
jgi:hypothetical protein